MESELTLGQVVRSNAGRDKGRFFIVVSIEDERYVSIADGDLRKADKKKRKKRKHLAKTNHVNRTIQQKYESGLKVSNADLRRALENFKREFLSGEQEG
ncbi:MAG TPA: RNA-binding protein [Eubacteriaceae bacterium]|nr:RNA-binding protein [Eubacteriaceae bacterium]